MKKENREGVPIMPLLLRAVFNGTLVFVVGGCVGGYAHASLGAHALIAVSVGLVAGGAVLYVMMLLQKRGLELSCRVLIVQTILAIALAAAYVASMFLRP
jgi:hypothetical protein